MEKDDLLKIHNALVFAIIFTSIDQHSPLLELAIYEIPKLK